MAEIATIARPYAEALLKAAGDGDAARLAAEVRAMAQVASDPQVRALADNPKVGAKDVADVVAGIAKAPDGQPLGDAAKNLLALVIDNGRFAALPEIASQFEALVDARAGTSQATIESAFALDDRQIADVRTAMEKRFGRKLEATVAVVPDLIGGVRVVVGDEVLDTSIRARLAQMRAALTA